MKRLYVNAKVVCRDTVRETAVLTEDAKILAVGDSFDAPDAETVNCGGLYLSPGFADIHVHGGGGYSAMSEDPADIIAMAKAHLAFGVTAIVPTTLAAPVETLCACRETVARAMTAAPELGILGIHFEGPFLSPKKAGAQSPGSILTPTNEAVEQLLDRKEIVRMIGAAPEIENGMMVGEAARERGITASVAHSDASFEVAEQALRHGYSDVTHLFSACSAMHKEGIFRQVGVAEAGLALDGYTTQFIGDLKHLPYGAMKLIYACKGPDKAYLISDGLEFCCCDLPDGTFVTQKNGQKALVEDGVMKLRDRSCLAGSVTPLSRMVKNLLACGVPLHDAVTMASHTPLSVIGFGNRKGQIAPGYDADLILFDEEIRVRTAIVGGEVRFRAES